MTLRTYSAKATVVVEPEDRTTIFTNRQYASVSTDSRQCRAVATVSERERSDSYVMSTSPFAWRFGEIGPRGFFSQQAPCHPPTRTSHHIITSSHHHIITPHRTAHAQSHRTAVALDSHHRGTISSTRVESIQLQGSERQMIIHLCLGHPGRIGQILRKGGVCPASI